MNCPICKKHASYFSSSNYYRPDGSTAFIVPVFYCKNCNTLVKDIEDTSLSSHFKNSPWTRLKYADYSFKHKLKYFNYIYKLAKSHNKSTSSWLDFGCSYGHFITFLHGKKVKSFGIEISDDIQKHAKTKGLIIWQKMEDLPSKITFDTISSIDSFYYLKDPKIVLKQMYDKLNDNGLIIIRISTRNWLAKFNKYILRKTTVTALNDHSISYSKKSISHLLKNGGFKILRTTNIEIGKVRPLWSKFLNFITLFVSFMSMGLLNFSPGLIIIARKIPKHINAEQ